MNDPLLVRVLHGLADRHEEFEAFFRSEPQLVAKLVQRQAGANPFDVGFAAQHDDARACDRAEIGWPDQFDADAGETRVEVPAKRVPYFRMGKELKAILGGSSQPS